MYIGSNAAPYDVYDCTSDHKRDGPARFLTGFEGYLQADAFSGYDGIYAGSDGRVIEVACWAHARRKSFEARAPAEASLILYSGSQSHRTRKIWLKALAFERSRSLRALCLREPL